MHAATDVIDPQQVRTIAEMFRERVRRTPDACAYKRYDTRTHRFESITWKEVEDLAARWQAAFAREGLRPGDRVAIALKNCLEWVLFDVAALGLGLVTVPLFYQDRAENFLNILNETGSRFLLIEDEAQWLRMQESGGSPPQIERIVVTLPLSNANAYSGAQEDKGAGCVCIPAPTTSGAIEPAGRLLKDSGRNPRLCELAEWLPKTGAGYAVNCFDSTDLATIVYTSGTTGMPKGVMLTHANILENAFACIQREPIYASDLFLSFLPLSHTLERTVGYYIPIMAGACVAHVRSIDKLPEDLREVKPTVLISVPRIYERIYRKITADLAEKPVLVNRLFRMAVDTGWKRFLRKQKRGSWTPCLLLWPLLDRMVGKRMIAGLGGRLRLSISGGAPLAPPISKVFIGLGLNLLQGYGLTETSPVISVNTTKDNIPATVGRPLSRIACTVAGNGELLVKGPSVMAGYWRSGEASAAAIDSDGFFHTGDMARMDDEGHLTIVGRIKEIIVLSTGEKVSPEDIEKAVQVNPLFEQVMVVGEGRPFLAAVAVLDPQEWERVLASRGLAPAGPQFNVDRRGESHLLAEISKLLVRYPRYAQIRRIHATFSPWRLQDGLITATLKLRRKELLARFEREVESLYVEH
jgi:long-chain acyl-CoA synthetase